MRRDFWTCALQECCNLPAGSFNPPQALARFPQVISHVMHPTTDQAGPIVFLFYT